jgi:hypothetical protein
MLAGIRCRKPDLSRQLLDRAIAIGQDVDYFNPAPAPKRMSDPSELVEELYLYRAIRHENALCALIRRLSRTQLIS